MGTAKRAYDLLRGYVNREWDRIQGVEALDAWRELEDAPAPPSTPAPGAPLSPDSPHDQAEAARRILGVSTTASYEEIRKSFERLSKRSEPSNFPPGTPERVAAEQIRKRVDAAYRLLTDQTPTTEKRFKSLEIE